MRQTSLQGKTIAVTAAADGVGSLLIQLAKQAGAKLIIALAGNPKKLELTQSLGADLAFNYQSQAWIDQAKEVTGGQGIDIIYDSVGGAITRECFTALAPLGELVFAALNRCQLTASDLETMFQSESVYQRIRAPPAVGRHYLTRRAFQAVRSCPSRDPESLNRGPLSVGTGRRSTPSVGESVNNRQSGADSVGI